MGYGAASWVSDAIAARAVVTMPSVSNAMLGHGIGGGSDAVASPPPSGRPGARAVWGTRSWHRAWQMSPAPRLPGPRRGTCSNISASSWEGGGCGGFGCPMSARSSWPDAVGTTSVCGRSSATACWRLSTSRQRWHLSTDPGPPRALVTAGKAAPPDWRRATQRGPLHSGPRGLCDCASSSSVVPSAWPGSGTGLTAGAGPLRGGVTEGSERSRYRR